MWALLAAMLCGTFALVCEPDTAHQRLLPIAQPNGPAAWLGSDVATSIALQDGSSAVWLFGDTLVGALTAAGKRNFSSMPRNSVGVWRAASGPISHVWRPEGEHETGGFFNSTQDGNFLWVMVGAAVDRTLYAFAAEVRNGEGPLGFALLSTTLIVVEDATLDPLHWRTTQIGLPFTNSVLQFSSAALVHGDYLYVLGSNATQGVMLRVAVAKLAACAVAQFADCAEFLLRTDANPVWGPLSDQPLASVMENVPSETTISWCPMLNCWILLQIPFAASAITLHTSPNLWGPFVPLVQRLYDIPAPFNNAKLFFSYAPKVHVELSSASRLVFTYVTNAYNVTDLIAYTSVYVPQFIVCYKSNH